MLYLGVFGVEFSKAIAIFEINSLKFVKLQNLSKKGKFPKLEPKMSYLRIYGLEY